MYAHYFKSGKNHILIVSSSTAPKGEQLILSSKSQVKKEAKARNLKPWNF